MTDAPAASEGASTPPAIGKAVFRTALNSVDFRDRAAHVNPEVQKFALREREWTGHKTRVGAT